MKSQQRQSESNRVVLTKYAGLGFQILASLAIAVFLGLKGDKWLKLSFPLLTWLAPLIILFVIFYKVFRDTSNKKDSNEPPLR